MCTYIAGADIIAFYWAWICEKAKEKRNNFAQIEMLIKTFDWLIDVILTKSSK